MPYTCKLIARRGWVPVTYAHADTIMARLKTEVSRSRFTADISSVFRLDTPGPKTGSGKFGVGFTITRVRLREKKEYCGQHPGECVVPFGGPRPKKVTAFLEWDDWVAFHGIVNDVLDELEIFADVWTRPHETNGAMWVRKGLRRRVKWDYEREYLGTGQVRDTWNLGTDDQFKPLERLQESAHG